MLVRVEDEGRRRLVDGFDGELFVVVADVLDLRPRKVDARLRLVLLLVDVEADRRHAQPQLRVALVLQTEQKKILNNERRFRFLYPQAMAIYPKRLIFPTTFKEKNGCVFKSFSLKGCWFNSFTPKSPHPESNFLFKAALFEL